MPTYVIAGQRYNVPDNMPLEQVIDIHNEYVTMTAQRSGEGGNTSFNPAPREKSDSFLGNIDPETLRHDKDWLQASRILWDMNNGPQKPFKGSDKDLAEYGLDQMGWFNYNLPRMALDARSVQNATSDQKKAFLYLMNTYDDLEMSWSGFGRFIKGVAADPTTYVGLTTLGIGTAASSATKVASKEALKSALRAGIVTGVEGAVYGAVDASARQAVEIAADPSQEFSMGRVAAGAGLGALAGGVLGGAFDVGATALRRAAPNMPQPSPESPAPSGPPTTDMVQQGLDFGARTDPQSSFPAMGQEQIGLPMEPPTVAPPGPAESMLEWRKRMTPVDQPAVDLAEVYAREDAQRAAGELPPTPTQNLPGQTRMDLGAAPDGSYAYDGQGRLFPTREDLFGTVRAEGRDEEGKLLVNEAGNVRVKESDGNVKFVTGPEDVRPDKQPLVREAIGAPSPQEAERLQKAMDHVKAIGKNGDGNAVDSIIQAIRDASNTDGWRLLPGTNAEMSEAVSKAVKLLNKLDIRSLADAARIFEQAGMTPPQEQALKKAINDASQKADEVYNALLLHQAATKGTARRQADRMLAEYEPVHTLLSKLYLDSSSGSGATLQMSRFHALSGERRSFADPRLMAERDGKVWDNLTDRQKDDYRALYLKKMNDYRESFRTNEQVKAIEARIEAAKEANTTSSWAEADKLLVERRALIDSLAEADAENVGLTREAYRNFSKYLNEYVISTVFTPSTTIVNTIPSVLKTIYKPLINNLVDPKGSVRGLVNTYSAMWNHIPFAVRAAKAAFIYEKAFLTGDVSKYLEQEPAFKGTFGRVLRTFPRILNATDEFFSQLNYRGFVIGEATNDALQSGIEAGLKGQDLEDHIARNVRDAIEKAYAENYDAVAAIDFLRQQGIERGFSGERLQMFMKTELEKNADLFKQATNIEGRNYVNDLLFKREFTGSTTSSRLAKSYEAFMNQNALARVGFQLFVRTPIRVFEEGVRLTPGLNLVAPKFLNDLKGVNGHVAQVRAQGEALMSMAFGGAVLALYANGMITGGGPSNYKQRRDKENPGDWQPYTIYLGGTDENGKPRTVSFRNLDPFATPLKIMVNALDKMQMYQYRKAQGAFEKDPTDEVTALIGVSAGSVFQAVKDASLTEGISQFADLISAFSDPENKGEYITRFFGQKLQLAVPNVIGKTKGLIGDINGEDPVMRDPKTVGQMLAARFDPYDDSVPAQRDILGKKRVVSNATAAYFGIGFDNLMDRPLTDMEKEVMREIVKVDAAADVSFAFPFKAEAIFGDTDLRKKYLPDGKTTYFDAIADIYAQNPPTAALYNLLVENRDNTTYSTEEFKNGTKVDYAKKIVKEHFDYAARTFARENKIVMDEYMQQQERKAKAKLGAFDIEPPR